MTPAPDEDHLLNGENTAATVEESPAPQYSLMPPAPSLQPRPATSTPVPRPTRPRNILHLGLEPLAGARYPGPPFPASPVAAQENAAASASTSTLASTPPGPSSTSQMEELVNTLLDQQAVITEGLQAEIDELLARLKRQEEEIRRQDANQEAEAARQQKKIAVQELRLLEVLNILLAVTRERDSVSQARWNSLMTSNERWALSPFFCRYRP